jgi:hypothetical protein
LCENFKKAVGLKRPKNKPVAIAKLNNPINASAAESKLVKKPTGLMTIANSSKGLRTKKIGLTKLPKSEPVASIRLDVQYLHNTKVQK